MPPSLLTLPFQQRKSSHMHNFVQKGAFLPTALLLDGCFSLTGNLTLQSQEGSPVWDAGSGVSRANNPGKLKVPWNKHFMPILAFSLRATELLNYNILALQICFIYVWPILSHSAVYIWMSDNGYWVCVFYIHASKVGSVKTQFSSHLNNKKHNILCHILFF